MRNQERRTNFLGTVFKLRVAAAPITETILHSFELDPDGQFPRGGVVLDKAGNLYGTTKTPDTDSPPYKTECTFKRRFELSNWDTKIWKTESETSLSHGEDLAARGFAARRRDDDLAGFGSSGDGDRHLLV